MTALEIFELLGGVGLFLYGMSLMSTGLKNACGERIRTILERATKNKIIALLVGICVTVLVQSSSATCMMVIGFVDAGLMTLGQAVGVILGANIGTTVTAQITAFNIGAYAPLILFLGAIMFLFVKKGIVRHIGSVVMGFGMLFVGIDLMKSVIAKLAETEAFRAVVGGLNDQPLLAVVFGVAFTALLQSSSSSTVIFQTFAVEGLITFHCAAYLCIGAAIGSVAPNLLAGLTANRNGKRSAMLNLVFNLMRAALMLVLVTLFPVLLDWIENISPNDVARQVANTNTIFATISVLVFLPCTGLIVKITQKILPIRPDENKAVEERRLVYMTKIGNLAPAAALTEAHKEIVRMGKIASENLRLAVNCFFEPTDEKVDLVEETEETVNYLENAILSKLVELRTPDMSHQDLQMVYRMTLTVSDIERLSDHAENIIEYAEQFRSGRASLSPPAFKELRSMAELTLESVNLCLDIFSTQDYTRYKDALALEDRVDDAHNRLIQSHVERLMNSDCEPHGGVVFSDMVSDLERCSDHAINIAVSLRADPHGTMLN